MRLKPFFFLKVNHVDDPDPIDPDPSDPVDPKLAGGGGGNPDPAPSDPANPPADPAPSNPPTDPGTPWPTDWRSKIANGDEKILAQLGRYASPTDIWNKAKALETRISSGELKALTPFPENGSDEQKAAWRSENGIPEKAADYEIKLPEGMVIGDADQPLIDSFLEFAHEKNLSTDAVDTAVNWYFAAQEAQATQREELDKEVQQANTDLLRAEYGENYRPVINGVKNLFASFPDGVGEALMQARLADGTPLASDAGVIKAFAQLAHEINPVTTLMGGGTSNMESINDEINKLNGLMANRQSEYWKGPNAEKMQQRYRDLVSAKETMEKKGQAA